MSTTARALETRRPSLVAPIACGCCLLAGAAYVVAIDPSDGGIFPSCPFRELTGLWCVGCGLTRATHHLLRGDLTAALRFNAFVVPVLAMIMLGWTSWLLTTAGRPTTWTSRIPAWVYAAAVTVGLAYAVVRNLPGVDGLRG